MDSLKIIEATVQKATSRLKAQRALDAITAASALGLAVIAVALFGERVELVPHFMMVRAAWFCLAMVGIAGLTAWAWPVDRIRLAYELDRRNHNHDRLGSALELAAEGNSPMIQAVIADAERSCDTIDPSAAAPWRAPGYLRALLLALTLAGLAYWYPPPTHEPHKPPPRPEPAKTRLLDEPTLAAYRAAATRMKSLAEELQDERLAELAERFSKLVDRLEAGDVTRERADAALAEMERAAQESARPREQGRGMAQALAAAARSGAKRKETKALAEAMAKGKPDEVAKRLEDLAKLLADGKLSPSQMERLAKAMQKMAKSLAKSLGANEELRKKLAELRKKLARSGLSERERRRLEDLERELSKRAKRSAMGDQERRAINQLRRRMEDAARKTREASKQARKGRKQASADQRRAAAEAMRAGRQAMERLARERRRAQAMRSASRRFQQARESMKRMAAKRSSQSRVSEFERKVRGPKQRGGRRASGFKRSKEAGAKAGQSRDDQGLGAPTANRARFQDERLGGKHMEGPERVEIIESAAQKGFAKVGYREVYDQYEALAEEELDQVRIPPGFRYYVMRYFDLIRPADQ